MGEGEVKDGGRVVRHRCLVRDSDRGRIGSRDCIARDSGGSRMYKDCSMG